MAGGLCWTWPEADTAVIGRFVNRPYEWVSEYGSRGASRSARVGHGRKPKKRWEQAPALCAAFYNPPVILNRAAVKNPANWTPKPQNTGSFTPFRMTEYFLAGGLCWTWSEADTAVNGRFVNRPYEWASEYGSRGASRSARVGHGRKPKKRREQAPALQGCRNTVSPERGFRPGRYIRRGPCRRPAAPYRRNWFLNLTGYIRGAASAPRKRCR